MVKKKGISHEQRIINVLNTLPEIIEDKKHRIKVMFADEHARSNESRFEHISLKRHELKPSDIKRIKREISNSVLLQEKGRTKTFNLYIKRNGYSNEYIKISLILDFRESNVAKVKTIFITKIIK